MARKKAFRRSRRSTVAKRATSKGINFMNRPTTKGLLYGLVREPINTATKNLLSSVPGLGALGNVGDEVLLWLLGTAGSNMTKGGLKEQFKAIQIVEAQNLGRQINIGGLGSLLGNATNSNETSQTSGDGWS